MLVTTIHSGIRAKVKTNALTATTAVEVDARRSALIAAAASAAVSSRNGGMRRHVFVKP
jgi:hypothetical protein